jgi:hypothetical protein
MNRELPAPVKGIVNAFHRGTVLTQRICKAIQQGHAPQMLDAFQPAQGFEQSLTRSEIRIKDAYAQNIRDLGPIGQRYPTAIDSDRQ